MFDLPSRDNINEVVINGDVIEGKSTPIVAYSSPGKDIETSA